MFLSWEVDVLLEDKYPPIAIASKQTESQLPVSVCWALDQKTKLYNATQEINERLSLSYLMKS